MGSLWNEVSDALLQNSWILLLQLLLTVCLLTWSFTQFRSNLRPESYKAGTKAIPRLSYLIPILGNTPDFFFRNQSWLLDKSKRLQSNVFGLKLYGSNYIVVTSPTLQAQLTDTSTPVSTKDHDLLQRSRFFANKNASIQSLKPGGSYLADSSSISKITRLLEINSYNFISPAKSWVDQAQWERGASVKVLQDKPILSVSAVLTKLTQDFSSHIFLSALLSTSFLEANSGFIGDFFNFSSSYDLFMTGLPYWIAPGLGPPALAREKCLLALDGLVEAMTAELKGKSMTGTGAGMLYDLDDVHPVIWSIVKQSKTEAVSERIHTRKCACEILEAVWNTTFTSVDLVLWMLVYLFDRDGDNKTVLEHIKTEIQKVVKIVKPQPTGLPFEDPPRLEFAALKGPGDLEKQCPTLYGAFLEVLRLETEPEAYLTVQDDFVLTGDAAPDPRSTKKPALLSNVVERFQLVKGDRIYAAYGATFKDSYYWDRPRRFAPNRYGLAGGASATQVTKTSLTRHADNVSHSMYIVIALLSFYEFEGISHPGKRIIAGVGVPKGDLRATISRRKI